MAQQQSNIEVFTQEDHQVSETNISPDFPEGATVAEQSS